MSRGVGTTGGGAGEIGAEVDFATVDIIDEGVGVDSPRSSRISCAISAARPKSSSATAARFSSSKISILIESVAEIAAGDGVVAAAAAGEDESPVEAVEAADAAAALGEEAEEGGTSGEGVTAVVDATFTAPLLPALAAFAALAASRRASTELRVAAAAGGGLGGADGADEEEEDSRCLDTLLS